MSDQAIDYSDGVPSAEAVVAAGYKAVLRYVAPLPNRKVITAGEVEDMHRHGVGIGIVFEGGEGNALGGFDAGVRDAHVATDELDALGAPADVAIYYAVDQDVYHQSDVAACVDYWRGACTVGVRPVGGYGGRLVLKAGFDADNIVFGWAAAARSWDHSVIEPRINIQQLVKQVTVDGVTCDVDTILTPNFGGWFPMQQRHHVPTILVDWASGLTGDGRPWCYALGEDGGIFDLGETGFHGNMVGDPDFAGRKGAALHVLPDGSDYTIEDTADELYRPSRQGPPFRIVDGQPVFPG